MTRRAVINIIIFWIVVIVIAFWSLSVEERISQMRAAITLTLKAQRITLQRLGKLEIDRDTTLLLENNLPNLPPLDNRLKNHGSSTLTAPTFKKGVSTIRRVTPLPEM